MKKLFHILFSRLFSVVFLILLQVAILVVGILMLSQHYIYYYVGNVLLSIGIVVWLVSKNSNPSIKLPWAIVILLIPIFGGIFYLLFGSAGVSLNIKKKLHRLLSKTRTYYPQQQDVMAELEATDQYMASECKYIQNVTGAPVYQNTATKYLTPGEAFFDCLVAELEKAERFIFMEYFIVQEGKMWNTLLDVMARKAKAGVEVRMMYDDVGCVSTLPKRYHKKLEEMGIQCTVFNPFRPTLSVSLHNRDHRKITVIDGHTAFTGGVNLADEYINEFEKHGHWKDASLMIKGEAVWNLTMLFLESWNFYCPTDQDYSIYRLPQDKQPLTEANGYVQPFGDHPFDDELVSETTYLNMIYHANQYLYINTPYFIVDNEMVTALLAAAKRGVDVRICTPHVADKWYVHMITQAYYPVLWRAGVKLYEYTPGFIHSKTFVADDRQAIVGTINLDYRSLYHHFECGVLMYQTSAVAEVKDDFLKTLEVCTVVDEQFLQSIPWYKRLVRSIIRLFAPLM